ncbi:MAG: ATP:cob(I)alamin adenosyltransferase [Coriobacteriia bacterium]|nr:ATP:cob(I)alamin adenosyltransferase [Coriobacteriia bacterium]
MESIKTAKHSSGDSGITCVGGRVDSSSEGGRPEQKRATMQLAKSHALVDFTGTLDEAQAALGYAAVAAQSVASEYAALRDVADCLIWMQRQIFQAGTILLGAAAADAAPNHPWDKLLADIEERNEHFAPAAAAQGFILPGGSELAARIELARTAIRRLERSYCANFQHMDALPVFNRLSTLAFTLARYSNETQKVNETLL